jgi:hypothetical protein
MRWWKVLGLAGFAGVTATGVVIARAERSRRAVTPEEIRDQLHARLARAQEPVAVAGAAPTAPTAAAAQPRPGRPGPAAG